MASNSNIENIFSLNITLRTMNKYNMFYYKKNNNYTFTTVNDKINDNKCYLIRKPNNFIQKIKNLLEEFKQDLDGFLFGFRKSFKNNGCIIINPLKKNNFYRDKENIRYLNEKLWYPVKSLSSDFEQNTEDYILNENDIIKLGNVKYEVILKRLNSKFFLESSNSPIIHPKKSSDEYNISALNNEKGRIFNTYIKTDKYIIDKKDKKNEKNLPENKDNEKRCLICEMSRSSNEDPLLNICNCKTYHYLCLIKDLDEKKETKNNVTTYDCTVLNCEKCSTQFPIIFKIYNLEKIFNLLKINENDNLIILESLNYIRNNDKNIKYAHVIQLNQKEIKIGRNDDNQVVIKDSTVSGHHAVLNYDEKNGNLFLENKNETFGTLVLIKDDIQMKKKPINFQIGRTYITANLLEESNSIK